MKKALILHGTDASPDSNWFLWLEEELTAAGYRVWLPRLPDSHQPDIERYNQLLLNNPEFTIDGETILIGHSSGAVAILGLLQALPESQKVAGSYMVSAFRNDLGWRNLQQLFSKPFDYATISKRSNTYYFLHSDNDPYCDLEHASFLHQQIGGDLIVLPGQQHFSIGTYGESYKQFPYLLNLILDRGMTEEYIETLYQKVEEHDIQIWLDGGWGVDALLEKQTRAHGDLDIVIEKKNVEALKKMLTKDGFNEVLRGDTTWYNFMYGDMDTHLIDFHVIEMDENGNGIYGNSEDGNLYPKEALSGMGRIGSTDVRCISAEWAVKFHTGYDSREKDRLDVAALCEKFGIELPKGYAKKY